MVDKHRQGVDDDKSHVRRERRLSRPAYQSNEVGEAGTGMMDEFAEPVRWHILAPSRRGAAYTRKAIVTDRIEAICNSGVNLSLQREFRVAYRPRRHFYRHAVRSRPLEFCRGDKSLLREGSKP